MELHIAGSLTVLLSTGDLVVLSKVSEDKPYTFIIYRLSGGHLKKRSVISPCQHGPDYFLVLIVQTQELIAVSCGYCEDIKLVDPCSGSLQWEI